MYRLGPDNVELLWMGVGLVLLTATAAALVTTYRRGELGWFVVVLLLPGVGAAAYALMRFGRSRGASGAA